MGDRDSDRANYHHGNLRQALLDLALSRVEAAGLEALSLRDLASSLGVSKTAPYRHFPDRNSLLRAIIELGWADLRTDLLVSRGRETAPEAGLRAMGRAYLAFAVRRSNLYRLLFSGQGKELFTEAPCPKEIDAFAPLVEQIALCQAAGWRTSGDPQMLALSVWAQVHGAAELAIEGLVPVPEGMEPHEFWAGILETIL
ncbi:MAG: hypothetical protein RL318_1295 [Fibrobacterota bacterium]|jgi:AcrR family transcriptional regulator